MGADCCDHRDLSDPHRGNSGYRRVLWAVLAINAVMFAVEIGAGLAAGSAALQADALDFLGDAANYGISLFVVGMHSAIVPWRRSPRARRWGRSVCG
jgi:Co/Zn/Cd efflux system component